MISSNTRATRSRYSSPAQTQQNGTWKGEGNGTGNGGLLESPKAAPAGGEASRSLMQKWLEPSVQSKSSFEEAGLMRYGVLESMAPLGTMPKPKKPETGHPVRRIVLRPSGSSAAAAAAATAAAASAADAAAQAALRNFTPKGPAAAASISAVPSPPPASDAMASSSTPASAPPQRKALPTRARDDDDEYDPKGVGRRRRSRRASASAAAADAAYATASATAKSPDLPPTSATVSTMASAPLQTPASASSSPSKRPRGSSAADVRRTSISMSATKPSAHRSASWLPDRDFTDKVVEAAVDEALALYRYPTAWAIRTLYDEKAGDVDFVAMIEDVFHQTADASTLDTFRRLIEEKKREGKKDNQGCYYFVPPATNSRFTPLPPKPAPYAILLHQYPGIPSNHNSDEEAETRAAKKIKTSHATATPRKMEVNGVHGHSHSRSHKHSHRSSRHHHSGRTPSRKRARRGSHSSDSSLTSAISLSSPDGSVDSLSPSFRGGAGVDVVGGAKAHDAPSSSRPIKTRGKSLTAKQPVSNLSAPESPTHHPSHTKTSSSVVDADADASMPGRLAASDLFPNLATKTANLSKDDAPTVTHAAPLAVNGVGLEDDDAVWLKRRDAKQITNGYSALDSSIRDSSEREAELGATPTRNTRKTRQSLLAPVSTRATRAASKRPGDDADVGPVSPASLSLLGDGSSAIGSRATTPTVLRPTKKQRSGLRIKSSPMKKKGGTAAGVPRSTGEAHPSITNGAGKDQVSDNDEYCSSCGNSGDVVCCDGCPRSFHFECIDMVASENLPDDWYCNECLVKRWPSRVPVHRGPFGNALNSLEKTNARAFTLPKKLQTRFEGVKAGADGDYEEVASKNSAKKKHGYEELPDFFKQREEGQAVLCHLCQKPATDVRAIIPCSVCPFYWHTDCLDPPLAVPPVLKTWRCPAHTDDVLREAPRLAPAHRFRRVKGSHTIAPAISRGTKNNGHIEIDWSEDVKDSNQSGWEDPYSFGRTYRLPAKNVVLDFVEQLRRQGAGYGTRQEEPRQTSYLTAPFWGPEPALRGTDLERKVEEMQLSLNLTSLKQKPSESIDQLTAALLAGADRNVLALMAQANAENLALGQLTATDKQGLRALLAQMDAMGTRIRRVLGEDKPAAVPRPARPAQETTPVSDAPAADKGYLKPESEAQLTELSPPSTTDQTEGTSMEVD